MRKRDISPIPLVYQKQDDTCIYCSITWIQQWIELGKKLSCDELIEACKGSKKPLEILKKAKQINFIQDYEILDKELLLERLAEDPLMIGVDDYIGSGSHMMVGLDISEDGKSIRCVNWFNQREQEIAFVPIKDITFIAQILRQKDMNLKDKILNSAKFKIGGVIGAIVLALFGGYSAIPKEYGSSGVVANYSTTISGSGISSSDTSIPVSSVTLYTGETFTSSDLVFPIYLMLNPKGSSKELVECWGLSSLTWTGCFRGLSAKGGNTTSTVAGAAFAHSSGETVIMTDAPYFFNRFVDRHSNQSVSGEKTITDGLFSFGDGTGQIYWDGTNMGWSDNDGVDTYTFASGGSGLTASSTKGITITDSKILINASSSKGLAFDLNGKLYINASSTNSNTGGFLNFTGNEIYWDYPALMAKDNSWSGDQVFAGINTFSATTTFNANVSTTADYLQINSDANSANDAVRQSYLKAEIAKGYTTGIAGETLVAGNWVYLKASDGKLWKADTDADESTYSFVGCVVVGGAADATVYYARPGDIATGLTGLTAGTYYHLTGSAGAIATTPGTRFAKVAQALSTTTARVIEPKFVRSGKVTVANNSSEVVTTGFYPARIIILGSKTAGGAAGALSVGSDENDCMSLIGNGEGRAWRDDYTYGTVSAKSATGFTLTQPNISSGVSGYIQWTAFSE